MLTSLLYRKVLSKFQPDIKILFLRLRNFEKQIRSYKKREASCYKAFHIRRAPLFDKIVRKAGLIHYGAGGGTRTHTVSLPTDFESVTSANSIIPAKFTRHSLSQFKQIRNHKVLACVIMIRYNKIYRTHNPKNLNVCKEGRFL